MTGSFYLFRFKGIPIRAHWTLPLFLAYHLFKDSDPKAFKFNLAFAVILFISVLVHELGHALTARSLGGTANEILLWPLGGLAYTSNHGSLQNSLRVTLGGPFTHIPLALLLTAITFLVDGSIGLEMFSPFYSQMPPVGSMTAAYLVIGVKVQVILFLFNMCVPAYPLDCGHAIVEVMLIRGYSFDVTAKFIVGCSMIVSAVLLLYFHLFIVAAFIIYETWRLHKMRVANQLEGHPLFAMARNLRSIPKRSSKGKKIAKPSSATKTCPHCGGKVPAKAVMCGPCEKML